MIINEYPIDSGQVNGELTYVDGLFITIEKTIEEQVSQGLTTLITIEKDIQSSLASTTIITIGKRIENAQENIFYNRNGWEPIIIIGNTVITANQLTSGIQVTKNEQDNTTAQFTFILSPSTYNLYTYQGVDVSISVRQKPSNLIYKLFTGKVDVPVVNVIEEKLTLNCVADRRVLLNNLSSLEPYIGYYSATILGTNDEVYDRINARMSTIPSSLDFDSNNNYSITSWQPKASPDFTYGSAEIYRTDPQLSIDSTGQIINKVNISMEYGYQRHHGRYGIYVWQHPYCPTDIQTGLGGICPFLEDAPSIPTKELILSAIDSAGWPLVPGTMFFGKQFRSGSYNCSGVWVQWSTIENSYTTEAKTDVNGNAITDSNGNAVYTTSLSSVVDNTDTFTMFAQWVASMQFNQNVKETYTVSVQSPESIARYGEIPNQESYGYTANDIWTEWENYSSYRAPPTGVVKRTDPSTGSYWFNGDSDRATFNNAYLCALNKGKTTILNSHRNNKITYQRKLTPDIELKHTVSLTGKWVRGSGKCQRITHYLSVGDSSFGTAGEAYTEVTIVQYRGRTTVSETPFNVIAAPSDTYVPPEYGAILGTHLGEDPGQAGAELWNGYVGNKQVDVRGNGFVDHTRTYYQESFTVDNPAVAPELRDDRLLNATGSYNINLPNDNTEYEAYG